MENTVISIQSGSDVSTSTYWVLPDIMSAAKAALSEAEAILANPNATQAEIDNAAVKLNAKVNIDFKNAKQLGSKSSGGGGGGEKKDPLLHKGDTGSTGSTNSPSVSKNNVIDTTAGNKGATDVVANAIQNAVSQSGAVAKATFSNFAALDVAGLNTINSIAAKESAGKTVDFKINFDTVVQGAVTSRVSVDPAALAKVMTEQLPLGVYFNQKQDKQVTNVNKMFDKFFTNQVVTVSYDQKSPLAVNAELAAKLDLGGLNEKSLYIYTYNRETNNYTRIDKPNFRVDENGYSHITAPLGGSIIITDSPLTRK